MSPVDTWWRSHYSVPYGSLAHRESSPITQSIDFSDWVDQMYWRHEDLIEEINRSTIDEGDIKGFLENTEGLEGLADLLK